MFADADAIAAIPVGCLDYRNISIGFILIVEVAGVQFRLAEQKVFVQNLVPFHLGERHAVMRPFADMKNQAHVLEIRIPLKLPRHVDILETEPLVVLFQLGDVMVRHHGVEPSAEEAEKLAAGVDLCIEAGPAHKRVADEINAADVNDRPFRNVKDHARVACFTALCQLHPGKQAAHFLVAVLDSIHGHSVGDRI